MRDKSVVKIPLERFKERESGLSWREWPWYESKFQDPQSNCLLPDQLLVRCQTLSVCCQTRDEGANPLFVCCHLSNWSRKGRWISVPKVCDCLGLAMVCCMSWTPTPITVSTVWQWIMPRPMLKLSRGIWRVRAICSSWRKGLGDESHFSLREVFAGHVDIKDWIGVWETKALLKFLLRDLVIVVG